MTEDELVGWHHRLNGHEFEQTPGVGEGQGNLTCCSPWGCKESDTAERLNNKFWKRQGHRLSRTSHRPSVFGWCRGTARRGLSSGTAHPDGAGNSDKEVGRYTLLPLSIRVRESDRHVALGLGGLCCLPMACSASKREAGKSTRELAVFPFLPLTNCCDLSGDGTEQTWGNGWPPH